MLSFDKLTGNLKSQILLEALQDIKVKYEDISRDSEDPLNKFMYNDLTRYVDVMIKDLVGGMVH